MRFSLINRVVLAVFILSLVWVGMTAAQQTVFTDVAEDHPYYSEIMNLHQRGIINGYPDGSFQPDRQVNRAEILKIVFLGLKNNAFEFGPATDQVHLIDTVTATEEVTLSFPDVPHNEWFYPYVMKAHRDAVIDGTPEGVYEPARTVNLAEFLKILLNTDNPNFWMYLLKEPYNDVPKRAWFTKYVNYAKFLTIIEADQDNNIHPDTPLTRAQVAQIMTRYLAARETVHDGVSSYYGDEFHGRGTASGDIFDMHQFTAAHKELPFNTYVKVWNPENGLSVIVRVNDRGPFVAGRDFDLSRQAFETISTPGHGVIPIQWKILSLEEASQF